ncbi:MAG TPA: hypothetical protein VLA37_04040, partial [Sphingomonadaceae bacterium]|nr:hypothetical protein [Sphingomonadaceae bacterium]
MNRAESAMRAGNWQDALRVAESASLVQRDLIEWHRLRAGRGDFDSTLRFLERRGDWPGLKLLRRKSEEAVPVGSRADEVIAFFAAEPPQTGAGAVALVEAYRAKGQSADAEAEVVRAWLTQILSAADETVLLGRYGDVLSDHNEARLDMLVWRGAHEAARRMLPRVSDGHRALAEARMALSEAAAGVDGLIEKVPSALVDDAGLAYERMQWRARKGRTEDAIDLMLSRSPDELGDPERWAGWRRSFARADMRSGRAERAYELAANHGLTSGSHFADLEWLAGYIALTYQKDGKKALGHFLRFRGGVDTPISLGRAGYWEGRAHEAIGDMELARLAYVFGGEYQTSFYGLLAAEKAGVPMDEELTGRAVYPDWQETTFAASSVFEVARLLIATGDRNRAEQFLTHLTESLSEPEVGALGDFLIEA